MTKGRGAPSTLAEALSASAVPESLITALESVSIYLCGVCHQFGIAGNGARDDEVGLREVWSFFPPFGNRPPRMCTACIESDMADSDGNLDAREFRERCDSLGIQRIGAIAEGR